MDKTKCLNPSCTTIVDALSMDDDGLCNECHDAKIDSMLIPEDEEVKCLSDNSLRLIANSKHIQSYYEYKGNVYANRT